MLMLCRIPFHLSGKAGAYILIIILLKLNYVFKVVQYLYFVPD